jgi:DNA-binding MarR family transcriptional regulator
VELTLTVEERQLLTDILNEHHRELLREIFKTDHHEFKATLREKETLLESLLSKVNAADVVHV